MASVRTRLHVVPDSPAPSPAGRAREGAGLRTPFRTATGLAVALVLLLAVSGCGGGGPGGAETGVTAGLPEPVVVNLRAQGESRQRGTATLEPVGEGRLTRITIDLAGAPDEEQPARLRRGTCYQTGEVLARLRPLRGRDSDTVVPEPFESLVNDQAVPLVIDVRAPGGGAIVACGEVPEESER
jgi:hypothetical protein